MKILTVPLAGLGLAVLATDVGWAASPAYCALYAREYANQMLDEGAPAGTAVSVQDQAYYRCLNQDEDPVLPTASAYFGTDIGGPPAPEDVIPQGDITEAGDEEPVAPKADPKPAPKAVASSGRRSGSWRGSGYEAWTPEWRAWCEQHFPNSFDPGDGTVLPYDSGKRRFCY